PNYPMLKNSENKRRQKTRLWSCRADSATRCHHQFATGVAHRKVSLSVGPLSAFFLRPACCLKNCDRGKKIEFFNGIHPLRKVGSEFSMKELIQSGCQRRSKSRPTGRSN